MNDFIHANKQLLNSYNPELRANSKAAFLRNSLSLSPSELAAFKLSSIYSHENEIDFHLSLLSSAYDLFNKEWILTKIKNTIRQINSKYHLFSTKQQLLHEIYNIVIVTAAFKRESLLKVFIDHYQSIAHQLTGTCHIRIVCATSPGDGCSEICSEANIEYVEVPNSPLSLKWDCALKLAKDADAVLILGSDDFLSVDSILLLRQELVSRNASVVGLSSLHIISPLLEILCWNGYDIYCQPHRYNESIGAGRLISSHILQLSDYSLWGDENRDKGLDGLMRTKLNQLGVFCISSLFLDDPYDTSLRINNPHVTLRGKKYKSLTVLDVKLHDVNITHYNSFASLKGIKKQTFSLQYLSDIVGSNATSEAIIKCLNTSQTDL